MKGVLNKTHKFTDYTITARHPCPHHPSPLWTSQTAALLKQEPLPLQETLPVLCEFGRTLLHTLRTTLLPVEIEVLCMHVYTLVNIISFVSGSLQVFMHTGRRGSEGGNEEEMEGEGRGRGRRGEGKERGGEGEGRGRRGDGKERGLEGDGSEEREEEWRDTPA